MPKVTQAYFENKRSLILDAAERICTEKPLYLLTMKDVIKEAGLSTGAVYASFADIDELIAALFNRLESGENYEEEARRILQEHDAPEAKLRAFCAYMISLLRQNAATHGKLIFGLATILEDSARREKLQYKIKEAGMYAFVLGELVKVIDANIQNGYFVPKTNRDSILMMIFAFFDGFLRDHVLINCYDAEIPFGVNWNEKDLAETFAAAILFLLETNQKE